MSVSTVRLGHSLRSTGRRYQQQEIPGSELVKQSHFFGGYDVRDRRQDVDRNTSPYCIDVEVTEKDEITRVPGIRPVETYVTRTPEQMVLHSLLDLTAEIVLFDAPWLGIWDGSSTVWTDHSLPAGVYAWTNFGGVLVFSEGATALYARDAAGSVATVTDGYPAKALATFAGRIFAGHVMDGATSLPMGVVWSGASALHTDWTGEGSGAEELISNRLEVDFIQAMIPIGFDLLAIICRRSIWVGVRTGNSERPADFQLRIEGEGAVGGRAVAATPWGVAMLSDDGVHLFDGNQLAMISMQINDDLLPLDAASLSDYRLIYHPSTMRLLLLTPTDSWTYEIEHKRWFRRSLVALDAVPLGTSQDSTDLYVLGTNAAAQQALGIEDADVLRYFDVDQTPIWEFPIEEGDINQLITTSKIFVEYVGSGTVDFWQPDTSGAYVRTGGITLSAPGLTKPKLSARGIGKTGLSLGLQLHLLSGNPRISAIGAEIVRRGPRIEDLVRAETLIPVLTAAGYWVFLPYNEVSGANVGSFNNDSGSYLILLVGDDDMVMRRTEEDYTTITNT